MVDQPGSSRVVRGAVLALFFLSGACGLVYEVVWMRMLTLTFGATAYATGTILSAFFAGLALGGYAFGRWEGSRRRPLRVYAALEAGIGALAIVMPALLAGVTAVYVAVAGAVGDRLVLLNAVRFVLAFGVLMLPATLMGGTLPVMIRFFAHQEERLGLEVSRLYGVNTLGAVAGSFLAGFFLILMLGVKEAAWAAAAVNLLIAGTVYLLARRLEPSSVDATAGQASLVAGGQAAGNTAQEATAAEADRATATDADGVEAAEEPGGASAGPGRRPLTRLVHVAAFVSGFTALALEVLWTRALVYYLDNSTHAFSTILTSFLLGIALGSILVARFLDGRRRLLLGLGGVHLLIAVTALAALPVLTHTTPVFGFILDLEVTPALPWIWMGARFLHTLAIVLVPTVLMGMAFPITVRLVAPSVELVGRSLGSVYAVNTVGGVLGSAVGGFFLVPALGVQNSVLAVTGLSAALGVVLVGADPGFSRRARAAIATAGIAAFAGLGAYHLLTGGTILTSYYEALQDPEVLFYDEGVGATVKVYEDEYGDRIISINGFPVAGASPEAHEVQKPLAHLPMLLSPVENPRVNIVGFGAGGTSWGVMQYPVTEVDCAELVPGVVKAAPFLEEVNHGVLELEGYNLIRADGRNHLLVTDKRYDVISIDLTSPKMAGNGSLYSLEFYRLLRERLTPDGLVAQWLPFHLLSPREMRMIVRTFHEAFPHTTLWYTPARLHVVLLGSLRELEIDYASMSRRMALPGVQRDLAQLGVTEPLDILSWYITGAEGVGRYASGADLNTDDRPILEFTPAMAYFVSDLFLVQNLQETRVLRESVAPRLRGIQAVEADPDEFQARLQRRFEAVHFSISGDILLAAERREDAVLQYNVALSIDPTEKNWLNTVWPTSSSAGRPGR